MDADCRTFRADIMAGNQATKKSGAKKAPTERRSQFSTPVDEDSLEFIKAIEEFKEEKGRPFPSWTEVLLILKKLGYSKSD